jgi:type IV fimbrial biogenesis protein FimT
LIFTVQAFQLLRGYVMKDLFPQPNQQGLSLLEMMVTMGIVAIIASSAAPSMAALLEQRRLQGAAAELATDLQSARSLAVARNQVVRVSLKTLDADGTTCYLIHTGEASDCLCRADVATADCAKPAQLIKAAFIKDRGDLVLKASAVSMRFDPLHGTVTPTATWRIHNRKTGAAYREIAHVVNVMGRVRSCSPDAAVAGFAAC